MLGEALQMQEAFWLENADGRQIEPSRYNVSQLSALLKSNTTQNRLLPPHSSYEWPDSSIFDDWRVLVGLHDKCEWYISHMFGSI